MNPSCCEHADPPTSTHEDITVRAMIASDLPHVRALHRNLLPVSYPPAFFIQLLVNPRRLCFVATAGGAIIGFASAAMGLLQPSLCPPLDVLTDHSVFRPDIPRSHVTLLTLGVSPAYRRRGIGRALVHAVIQRLEGSCCAASPPPSHRASTDCADDKVTVLVQVQVAPSNSAGKCFYTHLGMMDQRISDDPRLHLELGSRTSVMAGVLCV